MTIGLATDIRTARMEVLADAIDATSNPGYFTIYSGDRPETTGGSLSSENVELVTFTFALPCASSVANGVLTLDHASIAPEDALNTGTASWARVCDGDGELVMDCDVTRTGQGGDITVNTDDFVQGAAVSVTAATLTDGNV